MELKFRLDVLMTEDGRYEVFSTHLQNKNICGIGINQTEVRESTGFIFETIDQAKKFIKFRQNSSFRTKIHESSCLTRQEISKKIPEAGQEIETNFDNLTPLDRQESRKSQFTERIVIDSKIYFGNPELITNLVGEIKKLELEINKMENKQKSSGFFKKTFGNEELKAELQSKKNLLEINRNNLEKMTKI